MLRPKEREMCFWWVEDLDCCPSEFSRKRVYRYDMKGLLLEWIRMTRKKHVITCRGSLCNLFEMLLEIG